MPRECGVSAFTVHHACRVLELRALDIVDLLDQLNAAKAIFFFTFDDDEGRVCYAVKPHAQHGDTPLTLARRIIARLVKEGRG